MTESTKQCGRCSKQVVVGLFSAAKNTRDRKQPWCRPCMNEYQRDKRANDPAWRERRIRGTNNSRLIKEYGISLEAYEALLEMHGHVCSVCKAACPTGKRLAVDHDHKTGRVRALLCMPCNRVVGWLDKFPGGAAAGILALKWYEFATMRAPV